MKLFSAINQTRINNKFSPCWNFFPGIDPTHQRCSLKRKTNVGKIPSLGSFFLLSEGVAFPWKRWMKLRTGGDRAWGSFSRSSFRLPGREAREDLFARSTEDQTSHFISAVPLDSTSPFAQTPPPHFAPVALRLPHPWSYGWSRIGGAPRSD